MIAWLGAALRNMLPKAVRRRSTATIPSPMNIQKIGFCISLSFCAGLELGFGLRLGRRVNHQLFQRADVGDAMGVSQDNDFGSALDARAGFAARCSTAPAVSLR